jgi:putative ABC transport system permease protein
VDRNVAFSEAGTLTDLLQRYSYAQPEFGLVSLSAFAGIGLLLTAIGVFSVMGYSVSLQTHEIGVRLALGAQRGDILRMVLNKGLTLVIAGILIGLATSFGVTRLLSSELWGVSASDPWTFSVVVVVVVAVGTAACLSPARRATRVDPLIALRYE